MRKYCIPSFTCLQSDGKYIKIVSALLMIWSCISHTNKKYTSPMQSKDNNYGDNIRMSSNCKLDFGASGTT